MGLLVRPSVSETLTLHPIIKSFAALCTFADEMWQ